VSGVRSRILLLGAATAALLASLGALRPRYTRIIAPSGNAYDLISVTEDSSIWRLFNIRESSGGLAILVNYYSRAENQGEARELLEFAQPVAHARFVKLIVVQQATPVLWRWLPFVRGQLWAYHQSPGGRWELVPDSR